jgi:Zn-dependent peptidase ImmA (M78 family)
MVIEMAVSEIEETEANYFAMELLMPRKFLIEDVRKAGGFIDLTDDRQVIKLAKRYRVSISMMAIRLGQLMGENK